MYERFCRRFSRGEEEKGGWEIVPIGLAALGDDTSTGHGGADSKVAASFTDAVLLGKPAPIDVYRCAEYTLPGILANRSAELGGTPIAIPDLRREPFENTAFWETVGLPETDPPGTSYKEAIRGLGL